MLAVLCLNTTTRQRALRRHAVTQDTPVHTRNAVSQRHVGPLRARATAHQRRRPPDSPSQVEPPVGWTRGSVMRCSCAAQGARGACRGGPWYGARLGAQSGRCRRLNQPMERSQTASSLGLTCHLS